MSACPKCHQPWEPGEGDTVRVRRYEVTESMDPAKGTLVCDITDRVTFIERNAEGRVDFFGFGKGAVGLGYVFLGQPNGRSTYLVTEVEPA